MLIGSREYYIKKIMATYNYDRENAEKAFEYMKYKRANYTLGKQRSDNHFQFNLMPFAAITKPLKLKSLISPTLLLLFRYSLRNHRCYLCSPLLTQP